jgi:thymidine kinase
MSLEIFVGPMFSGKSTRLIQIYKIHAYIDPKKVCVINHISDQRYCGKDELSTHDQLKIPCISLKTLYEVKQVVSWEDIDTFLINEAQFFGNLKCFVLEMVEKWGKNVVLFGLDGDSERRPFGQIIDLIPYCDRVEKLKSLCSMCRNGCQAIFTHRKMVAEHAQTLVGTEKEYEAVCRKCYLMFRTVDELV